MVVVSSIIGNYVLLCLLVFFEWEQLGVRVNVSIGNIGLVVQDVVIFVVDIGFIEGFCYELGLWVEFWFEDSLIVVVVFGYLLVLCIQVFCEVLCCVCWLLCEFGLGMCEEVSYVLLGYLYYLEDSLDLGSFEVIKYSVVVGLGISCLLCWVVEEQLVFGVLVELCSSLLLLCWCFYMLCQCDKFFLLGFECFWEYCWVGFGVGQLVFGKKIFLLCLMCGGG